MIPRAPLRSMDPGGPRGCGAVPWCAASDLARQVGARLDQEEAGVTVQPDELGPVATDGGAEAGEAAG